MHRLVHIQGHVSQACLGLAGDVLLACWQVSESLDFCLNVFIDMCVCSRCKAKPVGARLVAVHAQLFP